MSDLQLTMTFPYPQTLIHQAIDRNSLKFDFLPELNQATSSGMMRMAVLGSGSRGNATLIEYGQIRLLIDAGLSAKQLVLRMESLGVDPDSISAILITHEHSDHAGGLDVLLRKREIPVYTNLLTREVLMHKMKSQIQWRIFQSGQKFSLGPFTIDPFSIPHDAADPVGFVLEADGIRLGSLSDVGYITDSIANRLKDCDALALEANYDYDMLEADSRRSWATKQRIASRHGHLSNEQTSELVEKVHSERLKQVTLIHLSGDCNCPDLATKTMLKCLKKLKLPHTKVHAAHQDTPTDWLLCGTPQLPASEFSEQVELF
ncbi:MBL fold metallo-hydrolase [Persicirhabdus sediminis]|uniref:MBL fold metallo-hydrolase n=1 Tax=Persicirhabdus sediminis TaxID=454144 RepID=A0A8J7MF83_9BACT|nr:MBL fold metallo-hydrolase [Persicirhabdus sediminis]MBK1791645.1 MBL fold metallo-hydrolase [Persicirhabdus sediminis]